MKNIIGTFSIYISTNKKTLRGYLCRDVAALIGNEVVFNIRDMVIKRPTLDNRIRYSAKLGQFSFAPRNGEEAMDYVGVYNVIQKDEDTFILKRKKNV